ncbi:MAG TPA: mycofactocin biosynthesis glycosyltransferase MftF [Acidimicrobiales bacterium]
MTGLPHGFRLVLDRSVRCFRDGTVLVGGHPGRLITLTPDGVGEMETLLAGGPVSAAGHDLGRRLVDAGMAHPRAAGPVERAAADASVTVVLPVRDRIQALDRCLASVGTGIPVVVVDDASGDPGAVAEVCRRHGARLIARTVNGGPGVARNDGVAVVGTDLVAFVDSDCTVPAEWLRQLTWMFDDPCLGAVAPRVRPDPAGPPAVGSALSRFTGARSALDMGPDPSEVGPDRPVRYVPAAALVVRRAALAAGFDPDLRVGEDVDLVWRLLDAGWRVRYEPSAVVWHREPSSWPALLARRYQYGTSAGPLARRHPGRLAPVRLRPWPTAAVAAGLAGRPLAALALVLGHATMLARSVGRHGVPSRLAIQWSAQGAGWTLVGVGHAATMLAGPALAVGATRGRRVAVVAALLVLVPPAVDWWRRRPGLDPLRWATASIADDVAYGAGVWAGCLRSRSFGPLLPGR